MHDAPAKPRLAREVLAEMNRVVIAGKLGEADHVLVLDGLADRLAHADREVFEIEDLKRGLLHRVRSVLQRAGT